MVLCKVGAWAETLDADDTIAFDQAADNISRIDLYKAICTSHGSKPYGITAMKDHIRGVCCCD